MAKTDKTKVTPKVGRGLKTEKSGRKQQYIEEELIIEALRKTNGLVVRARDYLEKKYDIRTSSTTLNNRIDASQALKEVLVEERSRRVEDCLDMSQQMAMKGNRDSTPHIFNMLDHWGHLIGFEKAKHDDSSSQRQLIQSAYNQMNTDID
ncbi:MAG: hypothetical protein ACI7YS_17750 [Flavobacterium sp.]